MIRKSLGLMALAGGIALVACAEGRARGEDPSSDSFCAAKAAEECKQVRGALRNPRGDVQRQTHRCLQGRRRPGHGPGTHLQLGKAETCITKTTEVYKDKVIDSVKEEAFKEACERSFPA